MSMGSSIGSSVAQTAAEQTPPRTAEADVASQPIFPSKSHYRTPSRPFTARSGTLDRFLGFRPNTGRSSSKIVIFLFLGTIIVS
jgi:hypothetical protein